MKFISIVALLFWATGFSVAQQEATRIDGRQHPELYPTVLHIDWSS
jgi:hypothetical protein